MEDFSSSHLIEIQNSMRSKLIHDIQLDSCRYVAGADLTVEDDFMVGCFVVVDCADDYKVVYSKCTDFDVKMPYIPGLLCFREGPVVVSLYNEFAESRPDIKLDIILVDGCGEWHPRGFGLACFVGLQTGVPTAGVSKTFLYVGSDHHGKSVQNDAQEALPNKGDYMVIEHTLEDGFNIRCAVMRTTDSVPFKPIFISCGHLCNMESSVRIVRQLCHFREPEPLRLADRISREFVRTMKKTKPTNP